MSFRTSKAGCIKLTCDFTHASLGRKAGCRCPCVTCACHYMRPSVLTVGVSSSLTYTSPITHKMCTKAMDVSGRKCIASCREGACCDRNMIKHP